MNKQQNDAQYVPYTHMDKGLFVLYTLVLVVVTVEYFYTLMTLPAEHDFRSLHWALIGFCTLANFEIARLAAKKVKNPLYENLTIVEIFLGATILLLTLFILLFTETITPPARLIGEMFLYACIFSNIIVIHLFKNFVNNIRREKNEQASVCVTDQEL